MCQIGMCAKARGFNLDFNQGTLYSDRLLWTKNIYCVLALDMICQIDPKRTNMEYMDGIGG